MSPWRYGHITRTALGAALAGESSSPGRGNIFDLFIKTGWGELLSPSGTHGVSSPQGAPFGGEARAKAELLGESVPLARSLCFKRQRREKQQCYVRSAAHQAAAQTCRNIP